jgi:hypothetical protein
MILLLTLQIVLSTNSLDPLLPAHSWLTSCHPVRLCGFLTCASDGLTISVLVAKVPEWVPGAGFKRKAREWHDTLEEMVAAPYKFVKDQMVRLHLMVLQSCIKVNFTGRWYCPQIFHLESVGGPYFVGGRGPYRKVVCCIPVLRRCRHGQPPCLHI